MTTITLRRAAKIRNRLEGRLNEIKMQLYRDVQVSVNVYDPNPSQLVSTASKNFEALFARFSAVSAAVADIRSAIGTANVSAGIPVLVAEQTAAQGRLATFNSILQATESNGTIPTTEQIDARTLGLRTKSSDGYIRHDNITFSVLTTDVVTNMKNHVVALQSQIDDLQEKMESINSTTIINLSDETLTVLKSEKLM